MSVANREVVEPSFEAGVSRDWEIGLITFHIKSAAVHTSDVQSLVARFACRKRHRQIHFPANLRIWTGAHGTGYSAGLAYFIPCCLRSLIGQ
jgi:hypothetical protein